jgi:hypothetical protein
VSSWSRRCRAALPLLALPVLAWAFLARGDALAGAAGTYRLSGAAHVEAIPFPAHDEEIHADAVLSPGPGPRGVRLALAVDTFRCELRATLDAAGGLAFPPGQRCPVALGELGEGHAEATLRAGSGSLRGDALDLTLAFALSGRVRLRAGGALDAVGSVLSLPGTGGRFTDVTGEARGQAAGRLDASRGADAKPAAP